MATCKLRVVIPVYEEHPTTPPTLDRCEAHGLWFDAEELARVFAVISRLTGGGGGGRRGGTMRPGAGRGWGFG